MNRFYRVVKMDVPSGERGYVIYQVYYDEQGSVELVSTDPVSPCRNTVAELEEDLERIRQALDLPVLEMGDVLSSLETSGARAYGEWLREQIEVSADDTGSTAETKVSHEEMVQTQHRKLEMIAAKFAEKRRQDPTYGE